ncbi:MAG: hypothetical protein FJY66_05925 [Calditrichaeota bacterium]|nr:hypothetical protein [Calditrichota bacterium]
MAKNQNHVVEEQRRCVRTEEEENLGCELFELVRLGTLVRGIMHNLSTPLSGVIGGIQLLEMRAAAITEGIEKLKKPSEGSWQEIQSHHERNQKNIELISRNARNLADLLQNFVERMNRFTLKAPDIYSLNQLVEMELRFLDSNLTFKHRVRKSVQLAKDPPPIRCTFSLFAKAFDEIAYTAMECHDPQQGSLLEMSFSTETKADHVMLKIDCSVPFSRFESRMSETDSSAIARPTILQCLTDLRIDGWETEMRASSRGTIFELAHASMRLASLK